MSSIPTLDIRALPSTQETVAYNDGGLFPVLTLTRTGDVVAVLRGGAGHLGLEGRIEVIRSHDMGHTWTPPEVVADSERDDRNPALGISPTGTLILSYHTQGQYDETGTYRAQMHSPGDDAQVDVMVTRSHDGGLTWETPYPLSCAALHAGSPFGKLLSLPDGTLIMTIYGGINPVLVGERQSEATEDGFATYLVRSHDDGLTWDEPSVIGVGFNETGLVVLPDGDILAVMRSGKPVEALSTTRSSDGGRTWSAPQQLTANRRHPADLIQLSNGAILLTYGNRMPPYQIEGRISRDGGKTWLDLLLTFSGHLYGYNVTVERPTDLGYPSSVVRQGKGVTVYYYNPSVNKPWAEGRRRDIEMRYQVKHYDAIAVTWDEAELIAAVDRAVGQ